MPELSESNRHTEESVLLTPKEGSWVTITVIRKTLLVTNICWPNDLDENRRCKILKGSDSTDELTSPWANLWTECDWIISGWKEKELSFKPIDIANNIPFNFLITQAEKKSG